MNSSVSIRDFFIISVIGKGTYAKVYLAKHIKENQLYALKVLKKKYIKQKNQQTHTMNQKKILAAVNHQFLVKLKMTFQDTKKLYFVLQYCPGGQLFTLLSTKDKLSEQQTKFFAAQIVLALQQLHQHKIIYRDLKPQNIIIDKLGYVKLTDFGLSKIIQDNNNLAMSICGTPQYLAPQIIKKKGHDTDVDWWCLGCLIYEMVTGFPPFQSDNKNQLFQNIVYEDVCLNKFQPLLQNLLKNLLQKDSKKRIGHNGASQIKKHKWFDNINWNNLLERKLKAPFIPILKNQLDTRNFDTEFTNCSLQSIKNTKSPIDKLELSQSYPDFQYQR